MDLGTGRIHRKGWTSHYFACACNDNTAVHANRLATGPAALSVALCLALACASQPAPPGSGLPSTTAAFDEGRLDTFALSFAPEHWATLQRTALDEEYVPARLTVSGEDLGEVGVRYKGAFGTLSGCFDKTTGARTCPKLSLKIKFDAIQPGKRWRGLKRVNLHALMRDPTLLRERLAYRLFREMGLPAPRAVHGRVVLDGKPHGVFAVVEEVDGRFTADRWPGRGDGNLYKEAWPLSTDARYYEDRQKTKEDRTPLDERYLAFARALKGTADAELPSLLDRWLGLDHLFRYLAVDQVISNWDGVTAFYCGPDGRNCGNHNFYMYLEEKADRAWLIPWDLDQTFSLVHGFVGVPRWDQPADCQAPVFAWGGTNRVLPPACDRVFHGLRLAGRDRFVAALSQLLDGPFDLAQLQSHLDRWAAQIEPAVRQDSTVTVDDWRAQVAALKADLGLLRARAELWREGKEVTSFGLAVDAANDLEAADPVGFAMGSDAMASGGSTVARKLNRTAPLRGGADARLDFEIRNQNTAAPWHHWAFMRLAFAGGAVDLGRVRQIRVRLRSNLARGVRVEVESPRYKATLGKFSAQVMATAEGGEVTVDLATLAFPSWGKPAGDVLADVLAGASGLTFAPDIVGRNGAGFFPPGASDKGWLQVDDIVFVP